MDPSPPADSPAPSPLANPEPAAAAAPARAAISVGEPSLLDRPLLVLLAVATLAKLWMLAHTVGSNDTWSLFRFGMTALQPGVPLFESYRTNGPEQNHPHGGLLLFMGCLRVWQLVKHPAEAWFWLRLPALAGDLLGTWALAGLLRDRFPRSTAQGILALVIVSPLIASVGLYHGNTDMLCVGLALTAALALERDRPALAGVLVVAAASVKVPAIVSAAPLGLVALREGKAPRFCLGAGLAALASFGPAFVLGGEPYRRDVFGYLGTVTEQPWPPALLLARLGLDAVDFYEHRSKFFVVPATVLVSLSFWKRGRAGDALACVFGTTLLLVPCFGAQYLAWFAAPVALLGARAAFSFHLAGAAQALVIYAAYGGLSAATHYFAYTQQPLASPLSPLPGFLTWTVVAASVALALARPAWLGIREPASAAGS